MSPFWCSQRTSRELKVATNYKSSCGLQRVDVPADTAAVLKHAVCRDKLFCTLTCQVMNKTVDNVRKHMKGRRFIQAKGEQLQL